MSLSEINQNSIKSNPERKITIGLLSGSHLGDALCTTPLAKKLFKQTGKKVWVEDHPVTRSVFANNPFVQGFSEEKQINLKKKLKGVGHIIQRIQHGFNLPVDDKPMPDIYLSHEEIEWASKEKLKWPSEKPICILSTRVITDNVHFSFDNIAWNIIAKALSRYYTVVQPIINNINAYTQEVTHVTEKQRKRWKIDKACPGTFVYEDLSLRQYMSLFGAADAFCGGTSGGAHLAAAFDLAALIVIWKSLSRKMKLVRDFKEGTTQTASFLYPQHTFILGEKLRKEKDCHAVLYKGILNLRNCN